MKRLLVRILLAVSMILPSAAIFLTAIPADAADVLAYPVLETEDTQYFMSTFPVGLRYSKGWFGTFSECPPIDEILLFDDDKGICIFRAKTGLMPKGEQGGTKLEKIDVEQARKIIESYPLEDSVKPIDPEIKEIMPMDAYYFGVWSGEKLKEKFDSAIVDIKTEKDADGKDVQTVNGKPLSEKQKTAKALYDTAIANKEPFDLAKYDPDRYFVMGQVFILNGSGVITEAGRNIADADLNVTTQGNFTFYMANGTTCVLTDNGDGAAITGSPQTLAAGSNTVTVTGTGTIDFNITIGTTALTQSVNSWSTSSGGQCTASIPTSADNAYFDANSFTAASQIASETSTLYTAVCDWTGATNNPTLAFGGFKALIPTTLTFISGMSVTGATGLLQPKGTFTSAGLNLPCQLYLNGTGSCVLADDLTIALVDLRNSNLDTNGKDVVTGAFGDGINDAKALVLGDSIINCTSWSVAASTTLTAGTSSIRMSGTGAFSGGGKTYYEVQLNGTAHTISGSNTFTNLILKADTTQTITFTDGTTQTITTPTFTGSVGKVKTLQGSGAAGWTVTKAGGGTGTCSYMSISRSTAAPGTTWYVTDGTSTNGGNNSGWVWPATPTVTTQAASGITATSATLNGNITDTIPNSTQRGFELGGSSGVYDDDWAEYGSFSTGAYDLEIETETPAILVRGTEYFYRAYATNIAGTGYGVEVKFLTLPDPPAAFTITQLDLALKLDWTAGTGAGTTYIRGKIGGYPADRTDGSLIYSGAAITFSHSPLVYGEVWYYRAWSYVAIDGLSQYSATYAQAFETVTGLPLAPTVFTMTQTNLDEATGAWVMGASASTTVIRWQMDEYPDTVAEGWEAYNGAGLTFVKDGLLFDQYGYYWRAWSWNPAGYSLTYAEGTLGGANVAALATAFGNFNALFLSLIMLAVASGFVLLSKWMRSTFVSIMAGLVMIAAGVVTASTTEWAWLIFGVAIVAVGLYLLIMVAVDLLKGD